MRTQICAKGVETKTKIAQKTSEDGRHNTTIKKLQPNPQTEIAIHQVDKRNMYEEEKKQTESETQRHV